MVFVKLDENTELRYLEEQNAPELFSLIDHNRQHLRRWLPWVDMNQRVSDVEEFIKFGIKNRNENKGFSTGIWYRGNIVGVVGYHPINWSNRSVSIGYWLGKEAEGKGFITKSVQVLVEHAFKNLNLNRIEIRCATQNTRSQNIPLKLKFQLEGTLRQAECLYGQFVDNNLYSLIKSEWN